MAVGLHNKSDYFESGMPMWTLGRTQSRMTSGFAYHHRDWEALTVISRRSWHAIFALGQRTMTGYIGRGMPLSMLDITHDWNKSGV